MVWCTEISSSDTFWPFPTCLKMTILGEIGHFQACRQGSPRVAKGRQGLPRSKGDPRVGWDELEPNRSYLSHFPTWYSKYSKSGHFPIEIPIKNDSMCKKLLTPLNHSDFQKLRQLGPGQLGPRTIGPSNSWAPGQLGPAVRGPTVWDPIVRGGLEPFIQTLNNCQKSFNSIINSQFCLEYSFKAQMIHSKFYLFKLTYHLN